MVPKLVLDVGATTVDTTWIGSYSWFIGCGLGFLVFYLLEKQRPMISGLEDNLEEATDGSKLEAEVAG